MVFYLVVNFGHDVICLDLTVFGMQECVIQKSNHRPSCVFTLLREPYKGFGGGFGYYRCLRKRLVQVIFG